MVVPHVGMTDERPVIASAREAIPGWPCEQPDRRVAALLAMTALWRRLVVGARRGGGLGSVLGQAGAAQAGENGLFLKREECGIAHVRRRVSAQPGDRVALWFKFD
jgi:hypothetical protein